MRILDCRKTFEIKLYKRRSVVAVKYLVYEYYEVKLVQVEYVNGLSEQLIELKRLRNKAVNDFWSCQDSLRCYKHVLTDLFG